ncbi:MAG TPA: DNA repair protein RadA [Candidatus Avidehalobacter gallistercoris]|uniref:DNA repair protein RadA n=1 Tax=Candidatus Avidehalobacter gallistercoris TaxID=2840694 RepID=A0A9D1HKJ5_9FIRM|nr:DNA repair protein RadA [Candidatus Avidehalobacter gallistercoris]
MKSKQVFVCQECGAQFAKWQGRCTACGAWNSVIEEIAPATSAGGRLTAASDNAPQPIARVSLEEFSRIATGMAELDLVLGGGLVPGSLSLLGGEPGIGKSTILLQLALAVSKSFGRVLYVSGEESAPQVRMRAERLGALSDDLWLLTENNLELILQQAERQSCRLLIVDSIQTVFLPELAAAPGSVSQVRQCGNELLKLAKERGVAVILVGHVTKEGNLAGPRVLEHMVDTVLYFEGDRLANLRLLRSIKNRFGSTNEIGVFEMTEHGLTALGDPSAVFLTHREKQVAGAAVGCVLQGARPVLLEIQALTSPTSFGNARRLASGLDYNRLLIILAVLEKKVGLNLGNQDVYVNVTGGLRVDDPAVDLAVAAAVASAYFDRALPHDLVAVGEIGLTGELRPIGQPEQRFRESARMGFGNVVTAGRPNVRAAAEKCGLKLYGADDLRLALSLMGLL